MWLERPVTGESLAPGQLCLTFDDGPGQDTVAIAEYLAEEHISATFFVVGKHVRERPDAVAVLRELGHSVGNHSFSHPHLTDSYLRVKDIIDEVRETAAELCDSRPMCFRPPYGAWTPRLAQLLSRDVGCNQTIGPVNWDIGGFDFKFWEERKTAGACAHAYERSILRRNKQNGIVLFHDRSAGRPDIDTRNRTLQALQLLIPQVRLHGLTFCRLEQVPAIRVLERRATSANRPS